MWASSMSAIDPYLTFVIHLQADMFFNLRSVQVVIQGCRRRQLCHGFEMHWFRGEV